MLEKLRNEWAARQVKHGEDRVNAFAAILLIGTASLTVRALIHYEFDQSALLYVGVPYVISLFIVAYKPVVTNARWWHQYRDHTLTALIVFLASSVVLFEGFVCVIFFLPIYFFVVSLAFLLSWFSHRRRHGRGRTFVSILPLVILASSFEGTSESLSATREASVTVTKITGLAPNEVMQNLAKPMDLRKTRHWLLTIFPMPYEIQAESLAAGDIHYVRTRYKRWFIANTHTGELHLQITDVQPTRVRTRFIKDTTFFSSYLTAIGTEITLRELSPRRTEVTLRIDYRRELDPAWYFYPLQQYGVGKMAEFLIEEVMIRE